MIVTHLNEREWTKDDGTVVKVTDVTLDDGREIPGYDLPPGLEVGKPLPDGWEVALSKSGKPYVKVPKPGKGFGGGAQAYRNTKEGQFYEQERMDRRTAVMQATVDGEFHPGMGDLIYDWLRRTAGPMTGAGGGAAPVQAPAASPPPRSVPDEGHGAAQVHTPSSGKDSASSGGGNTLPLEACAHEHTSPLKPNGDPLPAGKVLCLDCHSVVKT